MEIENLVPLPALPLLLGQLLLTPLATLPSPLLWTVSICTVS